MGIVNGIFIDISFEPQFLGKKGCVSSSEDGINPKQILV